MTRKNTDHDDGSGVVNDGENTGVTRRDVLRGGVTLSAAIVGSNMVGRASAQTSTTTDGLAGSGTEADPYLIDTVEDLDAVRDDLAAYYQLQADIDLSSIDNWEPIGSASSGFTGVLNGAGYTVNGLTIDRPGTDYVGLFSYIGETGEVTGVTLSGATIEGRDYVGALTGYAWKATVSDVTLDSATVTGRNAVGGAVGHASDTTIETLCASSVTIHPNDAHASGHGAIAGELLGASELRDTFAASVLEPANGVNGVIMVGGAVGVAGGTIDTVQTDVTVVGTSKVGGVAGDTAGGTLRQVSSEGSVEATGSNAWVGGVTGLTSGAATISDVYSLCDVTGTDGDVGGVVGEAADVTVERAYHADGAVSGDGSVGGVIGAQGSSPTTFSGLYFEDGVVSGGTPADASLPGVTGVTTDEITGTTAESTLAEFDFESVWASVDGDYPVLQATPSRSCVPEDPVGGGVTSSDTPGLEWLPWGIAGLIGIGLVADDHGEGGGE